MTLPVLVVDAALIDNLRCNSREYRKAIDTQDCQANRGDPVRGAEHLWIPARADYAIRALVALATADEPLTADAIALARDVPKTYLTVILAQLRRAGLVQSRRGRTGGYTLAKPATEISLADVLRAVDETVARPISLQQDSLAQTYQVLRGSLVGLLETVSVAQIAHGSVPDQVRQLAAQVSGTNGTAQPVTRKRRPPSPRVR